MLKKLFITVILVALVFTMSPGSAVQAEQSFKTGPDIAYYCPVKPGTAAWRAFNSHAEMLKACQVPDDILQGMSTKALVETVLSYPLYGDMLAYNNVQAGFNAVASGFNGLPALLKRKDAGTELLARYRMMDPAAIDNSWTLLQQGQYDLKFTYIEMLLAQDAILANLTEAEQHALLADALKKSQAKQKRAEIYGHFGLERTALLMGRILHLEDKYSFLSDGTFGSEDVLKGINAQTQKVLFGEVTPYTVTAPSDYASYVYTPKGSAVPVITMTFELTAAEIKTANQMVATYYPNAIRETNASRKYNCHSYAWYSTSTSNNIWMNDPGDNTYWIDGSYAFIKSGTGNTIPSIVPNGAKVSYPSGEHSAIKVTSARFRSKWGIYPRMLHAPAYTPYSSPTSTINYYQPNLILKAASTATSTQSSAYAASKGNDGVTATRWSSAQSSSLGEQWWIANMGSLKVVNNVVIRWAGAYAARFFVGTSTDGVNFNGGWVTSNATGYYRYVLGNRNAQYIGIRMTQRAPGMSGYSFWEAEAYQANPGATSGVNAAVIIPIGESVTIQIPQQ